MRPLRENNRVKKVKFIGVPEIDKESRLRNRKRKPVPVEVKMENKVPEFLGKYRSTLHGRFSNVRRFF